MSDNNNTHEVNVKLPEPQELEVSSRAEGVDNQCQLDKMRMSKLEADLVQIDKCLEDVVLQMQSVKQTRDEMFATTKKIQQNLEISGGNEVDEEQKKKLEAVLADIHKREEIVKALEKRELLLSHTMLGVISSWADEVERVLRSPQQESKGDSQHQVEMKKESTPELDQLVCKTD